MNVNIRNRFIIFGAVFVGLFAVIFIQLIKLTLVKGDEYAEQANKLRAETITVSGARGSILDRNGLPLAYDLKSYNVQFYRDPLKNSASDKAYYTQIIEDTIKIIESNNGNTIDTFAIRYNKDTGEYYFDWGITDETAMARREENWRTNMYVSVDKTEDGVYKVTPEEIYLSLREKYQIPSEMSYDEARKILSIWQEVQLASWIAFNPVTIAYNVDIQAVSEIETHSVELEGMSIAEGTTRVYPRGSLAANVVGYLGRIPSSWSAERIQKMTDKGYSVDDLIGVAGIEMTQEAYLTGNTSDRQGYEDVEVDNMAVVQNVISSTEPKQGDNVVLTIDIPLQQAVEESLAKNIPIIRQHQIDQYDQFKERDSKNNLGKKAYKGLNIEDMDLAQTGAAIVMDIHTGDVLAMASYPSFDPNLFIQGMTDEQYESLGFNDEELAPLLNKAVTSRGTPGSVFKMVTGLAGLMEGEKDITKGITVDTQITDKGEYTAILAEEDKGEGPVCWANPNSLGKHKDQTIVEGLKNSCDYFFYEVAHRLGIDLLNKWGDKFGLTSKTGIELPYEATGYIGNQEVLYDSSKTLNNQPTFIPQLVKYGQYGIINKLKEYATARNTEYTDDVYSKTADDLIALAGITWTPDPDDRNILKDERKIPMGDHIRDILWKDMQIPSSTSKAYRYDTGLADIISGNLIWTKYLTVTTGIGQGIIQVTPIEIARYVSAVANGGTVYQAHIVDKIVDQDGQVVYDQKPEVFSTLDAPPLYLEKIMEGMHDVVNDEQGTARDKFAGFEYATQIGGKTGTAQVSNIDLEDNSWFVCFAPYDKPEIAVVVFIPHGLSGGESILVARDILQYYLDRQKVVAEQNIPDTNSLLG